MLAYWLVIDGVQGQDNRETAALGRAAGLDVWNVQPLLKSWKENTHETSQWDPGRVTFCVKINLANKSIARRNLEQDHNKFNYRELFLVRWAFPKFFQRHFLTIFRYCLDNVTLDSFFIFASFTFYYMYSYNYVLLLLFVYYFLSIIFLKQGIAESFNFTFASV